MKMTGSLDWSSIASYMSHLVIVLVLYMPNALQWISSYTIAVIAATIELVFFLLSGSSSFCHIWQCDLCSPSQIICLELFASHSCECVVYKLTMYASNEWQITIYSYEEMRKFRFNSSAKKKQLCLYRLCFCLCLCARARIDEPRLLFIL